MASSIVIIRDWSELPPELIERIAGTLNSIPDYVIFGAVCKSWRSASRSISQCSIRQPPWLFSVDYSAHRLQLHDPWKPGSQKTYTFRIPLDHEIYKIYGYAYGCKIYGSAYGCVLVYEYISRRISLFNPLEGSSSWFTLPQLPKDRNGSSWGILDLQLLKYGDDSYCVIFTSVLNSIPFCWRLGDTSWKKMCDDSVHQYTFHKGSFYLVDYTNQMLVVADASNLTVTSRFPIPNVDCPLYIYMVESSSGVLLMVTESNHFQYQVMQVDLSQQPPTFLKVNSIGEDTLFVTPQHSVVCFSAAKSKGFKRNCIYYCRQRNLYSLDFGDRSTRLEPFVHEEADSWLIPALSFHP